MTDTNVTELRPSPVKGEVTRPKVKDPTVALRQRRAGRRNRDAAPDSAVTDRGVTLAPVIPPAENQSFENGSDFKGDVTVRGSVTGGKSSRDNAVERGVTSRWEVADGPADGAAIGRYVADGLLAATGLGLSAIGMVETATYSLAWAASCSARSQLPRT
jgi:hypothetical protein